MQHPSIFITCARGELALLSPGLIFGMIWGGFDGDASAKTDYCRQVSGYIQFSKVGLESVVDPIFDLNVTRLSFIIQKTS
jgi:hypothetical protein